MITIKFKPNSGEEFELRNVRNLIWGCNRQPNAAGNMASRSHEIDTVSFSRTSGLQNGDGTVEPEDEAILLASKTGDRAYCSGEIHVTPEDDEENVTRLLRWPRGYVASISESIDVGEGGSVEITETIQLSVTDLSCNEAKFSRSAANDNA